MIRHKILVGLLVIMMGVGVSACGKKTHYNATQVQTTSVAHSKSYHHFINKKSKHLGKHLASISDNKPTLNHKNFNGHYTMIFYMHNCPHCQEVVPKKYKQNMLHSKHVQYRDVVPKKQFNNNLRLAQKMNITSVPVEEKITAHHGKIVHYHKVNQID